MFSSCLVKFLIYRIGHHNCLHFCLHFTTVKGGCGWTQEQREAFDLVSVCMYAFLTPTALSRSGIDSQVL